MNNGFAGIKLSSKDTQQQFKAHQGKKSGGENYGLNFFSTVRIVTTTKINLRESLKFKTKQAL